jgi:hypothetical protein
MAKLPRKICGAYRTRFQPGASAFRAYFNRDKASPRTADCGRDSRENGRFGSEIWDRQMFQISITLGKEWQCLTASHFDPEPTRGSLAGMPVGIYGGQQITRAKSCSTIGAMRRPCAMNSAIYARATLQASTSNSRNTTNLVCASPDFPAG